MPPHMPNVYQPEQWDALVEGMKLYRGFSTRQPDASIQVRSPTNRLPVDMPLTVQNEMDDWFFINFGIRFRQKSIFATGSLDVALRYARHGEVRTVRPISTFHFCWGSRSTDLFEVYDRKKETYSVIEILQGADFQSDDLAGALRSGHEIMLVGDAFQMDRVE